MAITLFLTALTPKPATRGDLGKFQRNPFIMAIKLFPMTLLPKPATGLGKIEAETVYDGDHAFFGWGSRQSRRQPATPLGKIEAETAYHGDRETKHDRIGEAIWIGKTIRIGETKRDGPCRGRRSGSAAATERDDLSDPEPAEEFRRRGRSPRPPLRLTSPNDKPGRSPENGIGRN